MRHAPPLSASNRRADVPSSVFVEIVVNCPPDARAERERESHTLRPPRLPTLSRAPAASARHHRNLLADRRLNIASARTDPRGRCGCLSDVPLAHDRGMQMPRAIPPWLAHEWAATTAIASAPPARSYRCARGCHQGARPHVDRAASCLAAMSSRSERSAVRQGHVRTVQSGCDTFRTEPSPAQGGRRRDTRSAARSVRPPRVGVSHRRDCPSLKCSRRKTVVPPRTGGVCNHTR